MDKEEIKKESSYDQKAFLQIRLHELLSMYDRCSINPFGKDREIGEVNYKVMFSCLKSVLQTIWSKLISDEKERGNNLKKELNKSIDFQLSYKERDANFNWHTRFEAEVWENIQEKLFSFRCLLEEFMDAHGFNPSKADPSGAMIDY